MNDFLIPIIFGVAFVAIFGPVIIWAARRANAKDLLSAPASTVAPAAKIKRTGIAGAVFDAREGVFTGEMVTMTAEQKKARQRRSIWMALALFSFVILVFLITMTKVGAQIMVRDL
jgi:uncharacterized Tic20 family protein